MNLSLTKGQYKLASEFFNDVAKGLFLGTVAGQAFVANLDVTSRLLFVFGQTLMSLLSLFLALSCYKRSE